ncbi:phosphate/phosphite/phosphonate ABC transporter substrate-binding protein [Allohahella marinimesophila]|uniref:Phosphonate transport system substrate-binding protein n=1 Tax=Allohahella marinimesophila TaxID=1054972 RepID=A0ABP7P113_9GAMM
MTLHKQFGTICAFVALCFMSTFTMAKTIQIAVTDLVGLEELQREFGKFVEVLGDRSGYDIEFLPVTNRTAAVEALRFKKVDFVLTGPAEYVVMQKRTDAKLVVGFSRPDYFAVIITRTDGDTRSVMDLKDRKVAFGSVGSTSKHLGPVQAIADNGLDPAKDVEIIHTNMNVAWEALKKGDVAAVGMNHINFLSFRDDELEKGGLQPGAFRVIARGPDLPNDVLMAGSHVEQSVIDKIRSVFIDHSEELVKAMLAGEDNQKYKGMQFLTAVKDSDYNYVRAMYKTAGYPEYSEFIGE